MLGNLTLFGLLSTAGVISADCITASLCFSFDVTQTHCEELHKHRNKSLYMMNMCVVRSPAPQGDILPCVCVCLASVRCVVVRKLQTGLQNLWIVYGET